MAKTNGRIIDLTNFDHIDHIGRLIPRGDDQGNIIENSVPYVVRDWLIQIAVTPSKVGALTLDEIAKSTEIRTALLDAASNPETILWSVEQWELMKKKAEVWINGFQAVDINHLMLIQRITEATGADVKLVEADMELT